MRKQFASLFVAALAMSATSASADDWSGFYAGGGLGNLEVDLGPSAAGQKDDGTSYGFHLGYRGVINQWTFGGEFENDWMSIDLGPSASVDRIMRVKATAGYSFGKTLAYLAAGSAQGNIDGLGKDSGAFFGFGVAYAIAPETAISIELLDHDFSDFDSSGVNADAWSVGLRASWKF
jgi:hypothetical protein